MTTKERILEEALGLFSQNGYDGTSMEQIAELVGIKAPSLYKHFKGKGDIFNTLLDIAEKRYDENFGSADNMKIPDSIEEFVESAMNSVTFTATDPMIKRMRIFLIKEQFRSKRLAEITTRHQIDGLLKMYTRIAEGMMERKIIRKDDPSFVAMELIAPCVLYIAQADREPECLKDVLKMIRKHLMHVCELYRKK